MAARIKGSKEVFFEVTTAKGRARVVKRGRGATLHMPYRRGEKLVFMNKKGQVCPGFFGTADTPVRVFATKPRAKTMRYVGSVKQVARA